MKLCRRYRIEGRVQGVWFRETTRQEAVRLAISGYAINLGDGSVEVLACGTQDALERLEAWLWQGPPLATVTAVVASEAGDEEAPQGFRTGRRS